MSRQYNRTYSLTIQNEQTSLVVEGLRISFNVVKDLNGFPNLAKIDIYNLSENSRSKIEKEFSEVILNVGYENNVKLLFKGQIKNIANAILGVDTITTIYAGDGQRDFEQAYSSFTLSEGATLTDILSKITESFQDVALDIVQGITETKDKLLGVSEAGASADILDKYADDYNFDWSIQDGQLNVIEKNATVNRIFKISSVTGMIGSPNITEIGADVTFLLNPEILPGRIIEIEAAAPTLGLGNLFFRQIKETKGTGRYKVQKITYVGDTHSNAWFNTVNGKSII